jgi:hypothetical protein
MLYRFINLQTRKLKIMADVENQIAQESKIEEKTIWESCCLKTDKTAVIYLGQFTFSVMILTFCAFQLVKANGDCDKSSAYIGLISFLMGKMLSTVITTH